MSLQLNLNKAAQSLRLSLDKAGVAADIKADLIFDMDVSGSFEHEHEEGTTSKLIARLVPYGMVLDPDGQMDVFTFSNGRSLVHHVGTVQPKNAENYITRRVVGRVPGWNGGTNYSYVLERNLQHLGWLPQEPVRGQGKKQEQEQGQETGFSRFLNRLFGGDAAAASTAVKKRSIVIFVTDGENDPQDNARTMRVLEASERRGDQVYFLFMGACEHDVDFSFLRKIANRFSNTGLVIVRDLDGFVDLSDEQLNAQLLVPELLAWLRT